MAALAVFLHKYVILLVLLCLVEASLGQETYRLGLRVINFQDVDLDSGQFEADFILHVRRQNNDTELAVDDSMVTFQNGRRISRFEKTALGLRVYSYFVFRPRNYLFPFDQNELEIIFQLNRPPTDNYSLVWDPSLCGFNSDVKYFPWDFSLAKSQFDLRTNDAFSNITVPQARWSLLITRNIAAGVKILLPPSFIVLVVLATFTIPLNASGGNAITRLSMVNSALISAVFYHSSTKAPFVGLLLFDQYMLVIYGIMLLSVFMTIVILRLSTDSRPAAQNISHLLQYYTAMFVWLFAPMIFLFLFIDWWFAALLLPAPSLILLVALIIWRRAIRPRCLRVVSADPVEAENSEEELNEEIFDERANDPDLRKEMLAKGLTVEDVRVSKTTPLNSTIILEKDKQDKESSKAHSLRESKGVEKIKEKPSREGSKGGFGHAKEDSTDNVVDVKRSGSIKRTKTSNKKKDEDSEENELPDD